MTDPNWLDTIQRVRFNPSAIQRVALAKLEEATGGTLDVVDPTNPFVFLLEASAYNAAAAMLDNEANTRKQYPSVAVTEDELYLHMSDADYVGRFASPAKTSFSILLGKDEFYARAVDTGIGSMRKLVIPRHTEFEIAGVKFTMQYPIEIRIMAHSGLQIVYDNDQLSPLQTLTTNIVDWTIVNVQGTDFIKIDVPVSQFEIKSQPGTLNLSSGFKKTFSYSDQFYYARVFYSTPAGVWKEMKTTHTDQVFDPLKPTALLKVNSGALTVEIPQVYLTTGLVASELRVDIYTTKGPLDMLLENYQINNFKARWVDLDANGVTSPFVSPLTNFTTMAVYSDKVVSGGSNSLTFEQLRERVMTNSLGSQNLPISNAQLTNRLADRGYDAVKDVDNITNRQYKATRALPRPADGSVVAGAGCTIQTLTSSMEALAALSTVKDNGNRVSILPTTLYQNVNGVIEIVPQLTVDALMAQPVDVRSRKINESRYMYSPFHYVLDMNNDRFELRAYFLDNPSIVSKSFVTENDTTGIAVATDSYKIERTATGYLLTIVTRSGAAYKALANDKAHVQLSYRPTGEKDRAYQNGTFVGLTDTGERIYTFDLGTNYDVDDLDNIVLDTFQMYDDPERKHATPLTTDFDIIYIAEGLTLEGLQSSSIDLDIGTPLLPVGIIGISRERLKIELGQALHGLWTASRSVVSSLDYARYAADVPAYWPNTVYKRDPVTGALEISSDGAGGITYVVLHAKDDPVLDDQGNQVYRFRKGDVQVDADNKPIVISTRKMLRQVDLCLLDGVYWFATEATAAAYKNSLPVTIVGWLVNDIADVSKYLLEQTKLFFFPKSTLGQVEVIVQEGQTVSMPAEQSFAVTFYLSGLAYRDAALRTSLTKMAVETINEVLQNRVVTLSEITSKLRAKAGNDAIAVDVTGLGGTNRQMAVTLSDDAARLSIKKIAHANADGTIGVQDDVAISFIQHTPM